MRVTEQIHSLLHKNEEVRKGLLEVLSCAKNEVQFHEQRAVTLQIKLDNISKDLQTVLYRATVAESKLKAHGLS